MNLVQVIKAFLSDIGLFSRVVVRRPLRAYQLEPARAIVESVLCRRGMTFAVVMSRQAGKNELSAQLEAYLMNLYQEQRGSQLVKASPTYKPQTINSKLRLRDCLENPWNEWAVHSDEGYMVRLGRCRAMFFSAHPGANVVGATANVLLECDEAQDVEAEKWAKDFAPMGAATNVTTVFYGTIWTSRTLLGQVMRALREQEARDGEQRVFVVPWREVAKEVPEYGVYVEKEIARLGATHPIIRTQYELQEIDEAGRLFPAARVGMMKGEHRRLREPARGERYVFCLDVAGEDEDVEGEQLRAEDPRRDSTVLTALRVDLSAVGREGLARYEVVNRWWWTGCRHADLYATISGLIKQWKPWYVVVDGTGVGAGLAGFLAKRWGSVKDDPPGLVRVFEFGAVSKSDLGWGFVGVVESGRYREYADDLQADTAQFWREVEACEFEVMPGPGKVMRWGVVDPAVHDDMLISSALVAALEDVSWTVAVPGAVVEVADYLAKLGRRHF